MPPIPPYPPSAEQRLALLEMLLDRIPQFFYVHNEDLRFQYAAADYFGCRKEEMVGRLHREVDDDPEQAQFYEQALIPIIQKGEPVTTPDLPYKRQDGTDGLLQANIIPFTHPVTGKPMMIGISHDVTADRKVAEEAATRAAYERELDIARQVQNSLLPTCPPQFEGLEIAARCEPAAFVGGDFYDFIPTGEGRGVIVLGDVTGHGVGSALVAAACRSFARVLFREHSLAQALPLLDRFMAADLRDGSFVTLAAVLIDSAESSLQFISAGHGPVVIVRATGTCEELPSHSTPLGLGLVDDDLVPTQVDLSPGDVLLVPSDGLFESRNSESEQFGIKRLAKSLAAGSSAEQSLARCFDDESIWRGETPASDDRTAVVLRCKC